MFGLKKKSVVVNVVNTSDLQKPEEEDFRERVDPDFGAHVYVLMNNAMYLGAVLIGTYFAADTIRHCVIHTVAVRVQPPVILEAAKNVKK